MSNDSLLPPVDWGQPAPKPDVSNSKLAPPSDVASGEAPGSSSDTDASTSSRAAPRTKRPRIDSLSAEMPIPVANSRRSGKSSSDTEVHDPAVNRPEVKGGGSFFSAGVVNIQERENVTADKGDDYERATGESLDNTLDIDSWDPAHRLAESYGRFEQEVADAVRTESLVRNDIRAQVLPLLSKAPDAPRGAGHYSVDLSQLRKVQNNVLFNGLTEAADGTSVVFETLPVKMVQIGIGLVNYRGDSGSWGHRIYRRDVRMREGKLVEGAIAILERRAKPSDNGPNLSDLLRRAVMTYGERAVLTYKGNAPWRMGHGNPLPYELLTGSGDPRIIEMSLPVLRALTLQHKKFIFVPSSTKDHLLTTIGNALFPLEYAIVKDFNDYLGGILSGHYRGDAFEDMHTQLREFARDAGSELVMGVFRASAFAPAQVFYAHADHAHEAAVIAMADSMLLDYRGFPMLLDLADRLCAGLFGSEALVRPAVAAFAQVQQGTQYLPERKTRVA